MSQDITVASEQFLTLIERMATNKDVDVEKLNALLDLQERLMTKKSEVEANEAFAIVCKNMPRITKHGKIDFGKGKPVPYAKWDDVVDAIKPVYEEGGFTLSFDTTAKDGGGLVCVAKLRHKNGHLITSSFGVPLDSSGGKQQIQGMGSSGSYGQRYATKNLFNLVFEDEDDDGKFGSTKFIDDAKIKHIEDLITETKSDKNAFLQHFEIASVENITMKDYPMVLNTLMTKRQKMKV